jgi:hypothetical protein
VAKPERVTNGIYVITLRRHAGPYVRAFFDDTGMSVAGDTTVLRRAGAGQAALYGLLQRTRDLRLDILDVRRDSAEPA